MNMTEATVKTALSPPSTNGNGKHAPAETPLTTRYGAESCWVNWKLEADDKGKPTKIPYHPRGFKADSTAPATWNTRAVVQQAAHRFSGIGLVFTPERMLLGVDLDHVLGADDQLNDTASMQFIVAANSYTEVSPSGDGLHVFLELTEALDLDANAHKPNPAIKYECYTKGRYFTVTDAGYDDWGAKPIRTVTPDEALELLALLGYPWKKEPKAPSVGTPSGTNGKHAPSAVITSDDTALLNQIRRSLQGSKFIALYDRGDLSDYKNDASSADAALCCMLAWWTDHDFGRIERLWLTSKLGEREKVADRADYRKLTIDSAIAHTPGHYEPHAKREDEPVNETLNMEEVDDYLATLKELEAMEADGRLPPRNPPPDSAPPKGSLPKVLPRATASLATVDADEFDDDDDQPAERPPPGSESVDTLAKKRKPKADDAPTHDVLAVRWSALYPDTTYGVGEFRRYANGYWDEVNKQVAESELFRVICDAKHEGVKPNSGILASVEKVARVMSYVKDEKWDSDPDLLVCKNGTLHIPSLKLREHAKGDYLTSGVPYDYDPTAECPEFIAAIRAAVPEAESFLQEFAGLALTTETKYEIAVWFQGVSGSGKSTIIGGLQAMLGNRVINLGLAAIERSQFALAKLPGKTLAISTEQPSLFMKAADVLNNIISGEVVSVERKYRDAVEIRPQVKLLWAMNELPRVPDAGNGLFRRVKVVKFQNKVAKVDKALKARIELEAAGILNWALVGLLRLIDRGDFDIPACVTAATDKFQRENDVPAAFLAECCLLGADKQAGGQQLYLSYKFWCAQNGHKAQSSTTLAADWERLGLERKRETYGTVYHGVGVIVEWLAPPPQGRDTHN